MTGIRLVQEARTDIRQAAAWYSEQRAGLGREFVEELDRVLVRIQASPHHYPIGHGTLQRARLRRFPYSVYFQTDQAGVLVFGVLHHRRQTTHLDDRHK